jgi:hypothetical protein
MKPIIAAVLAAFAFAAPAAANEKHAPLIELFTSQGCINCPEANDFVGRLVEADAGIVLTYPVGYWDYLGWRDTFARPEFQARQESYRARLGARSVYTPQVIVDGMRHVSAARQDRVRQLIAAASRSERAPKVRILSRIGGVDVVVTGARLNEPADVWVASVDPGPVRVLVTAGENAGKQVSHHNLVRAIDEVGVYSGGERRFSARCAPLCVAFVQQPGGAVLAATQTHVAALTARR